MKIDFHVHSTASDGTLSPTDLAGHGVAFAAIALTDHDNTDGLREFLAAPGPSHRVAGIELSIDPGKGFDRFHLLGLGIDPESPELKGFLRRVLNARNERNARIVANFARLGIDFAGDIAGYAHGEVLARPHFARWLVDYGFAKSVPDAFARYLADDAPAETSCYVEREHPSQEEAFRVIHGAGGICVMAHPKYWRSRWKSSQPDYADAERELARLRECGLDGLESLYQANTPEENVGFTRIAERLGLLKSAGSDFHGSNKPSISLGMDVSEAFAAPLLERLGILR